jgi:hypothetical protein
MENSAFAADYAQIYLKAHKYADKLTRAIAATVDFPTGHTELGRSVRLFAVTSLGRAAPRWRRRDAVAV